MNSLIDLDGAIGVYRITNTITGGIYVGSTVKSFSKRWQDHRKFLRLGKHPNRFLQRAWNKYGEGAFAFEVVEPVSEPRLAVIAEQVWIDKHFDGCVSCYNICPTAGSKLGSVFSDEARRLKSRQTSALWNQESFRSKVVSAIRGSRHLAGPKIRAWENPEIAKRLRVVNAKTYPGFISPNGVEYRNIFNLSEFCRRHGLTLQPMNLVANGKSKHHKNWRLLSAPPFSI